jgi:hypothetical protein
MPAGTPDQCPLPVVSDGERKQTELLPQPSASCAASSFLHRQGGIKTLKTHRVGSWNTEFAEVVDPSILLDTEYAHVCA